MLFQTLDIRNRCEGYYADGHLHYEQPNFLLTRTWDYSPELRNKKIDYARIYAHGKTLTEVCPTRYVSLWQEVKEKLRCYYRAFNTACLDLNQICLYQLLPEYFLFQFFDLKNEITQHTFENFERPLNHDFMVDVLELVGDIRQRPLNITIKPLLPKVGSVAGRNFVKKLQQVEWACGYNPWGTITGRLAGVTGTFPILTLNKEYRGCLRPQHDWFVELDYNAAEVRTLLALSDQEQPDQDIHQWNIEHIYGDDITRDAAKKKIFGWLYSQRTNKKAEKFYDKNRVVEKYWDGENILTAFNREIKGVDKKHALNYIVQSTTSDLVLTKAIAINKRLRHQKSHVAFMLHDSIIIDLKNEERHVIPELMQMFEKTRFGKYKVNVSAGKHFGDLRELNL